MTGERKPEEQKSWLNRERFMQITGLEQDFAERTQGWLQTRGLSLSPLLPREQADQSVATLDRLRQQLIVKVP